MVDMPQVLRHHGLDLPPLRRDLSLQLAGPTHGFVTIAIPLATAT